MRVTLCRGRRYESFALVMRDCGLHVDVFNCFRAYFDEMGGLGYTFEHPQEGRLRFFVFWYPRDCVGTFLETCVGSAMCLC